MNTNIKKRVAICLISSYSCASFYIGKPKKYMVKKIIKKIPENYILCKKSNKIHSRKKISIIDARKGKTGECVKNKLILYMNVYWEEDCCDMNGGIQLDKFAEYIKDDFIHIKYTILCDGELTDKIVNKSKGGMCGMYICINSCENRDIKKYTKMGDVGICIYMCMTIDLKNKLLYRNGNLVPEDILFGEILFDVIDNV